MGLQRNAPMHRRLQGHSASQRRARRRGASTLQGRSRPVAGKAAPIQRPDSVLRTMPLRLSRVQCRHLNHPHKTRTRPEHVRLREPVIKGQAGSAKIEASTVSTRTSGRWRTPESSPSCRNSWIDRLRCWARPRKCPKCIVTNKTRDSHGVAPE